MKTTKPILLLAAWLLAAPLGTGATETLENVPCIPPQGTPAESVVATEPNETNEPQIISETLVVNEPPEAEISAPAAQTTTEVEPSSTQAATSEETQPPPPPSFPTGALLITELYPAPIAGGAEWVELWNATNLTIDLAGFALTDAGGARTALEGQVVPSGYFIVSDPKGKLNNDGDMVALSDPAGNQLDLASYPKGIKNTESFARSGSSWFVTTTPTPLGPNIVSADTEPTETTAEVLAATEPQTEVMVQATSEPTAPVPTASGPPPVPTVALAPPEAIRVESEPSSPPTSNKPKTTKSKSPKSLATNTHTVALAEARELKSGTVVQTRGVVSMAPGIAGSRTFYLAGSGMQIYLHSIEVPSLAIGDVVELQGKLGSSGGETRIVVSSDDWLRITEHKEPPTPETIEIGSIDDATEGWLVTVSGIVTQKLPDRFIVEDATGSVPIVPKTETHIDQGAFAIGDTMQITGIVSETNAGFRLLPRSPEDVVITAKAAAQTTTEGGARISMLTVLAGGLTSAALGMVVRKQVVARKEPKPINKPLIL